MANLWYRLHHEFEDDPKVQIMPEHMQRRLVMLFCDKCKAVSRTDIERAFKWRISIVELAETKALFLQQGFIDEKWEVVHWNKRQFASDNSTPRVREYRKRMKRLGPLHERFTVNGHETLHPVSDPINTGDCDDLMKRHETVPDTDTDTDTDKNKRQVQKHSAKDKPSADPRAQIFRSDFEKAFQFVNHVPAPWDAKEATNLKRWLAKNPTITRGQWQNILRHRRVSPINHKGELSRWISNALAWLEGPADEWGKSLNGRNGIGKSFGSNKQDRNLDATAAAIAEFENRARLGGDGDHAGRGMEQESADDLFGTTLEGTIVAAGPAGGGSNRPN